MPTTQILPVTDAASLGHFRIPPASASASSPALSRLDHWDAADVAPGLAALATAAHHIRSTDVPVGFPTETVYGLGADATRSAAVRGIYAAKGRPSDNPLIVHVCDLDMLRGLLGKTETGADRELPAIYRPLVARFWPGPLTILLPVPEAVSAESDAPSASRAPRWTLAPEVTAGLPTFGARLPASALTRTLIRLADAPLAGPSANASTRPSPTTAQHVVDDLDGRIDLVLDGGACGVGVESTVVDGLCDPPVILRPGGISLAELRTVPGWERVERAYPDASRGGNSTMSTTTAATGAADVGSGAKKDPEAPPDALLKPRAPGMKYKHYSPKARVVLYEDWRMPGSQTAMSTCPRDVLVQDILRAAVGAHPETTDGRPRRTTVGVIRTTSWPSLQGSAVLVPSEVANKNKASQQQQQQQQQLGMDQGPLTYNLNEYTALEGVECTVLDLDLGRGLSSIAHGLFSALRDLDARGADVIVVEGIDDRGDDLAVAVMNRLRKAASEVR